MRMLCVCSSSFWMVHIKLNTFCACRLNASVAQARWAAPGRGRSPSQPVKTRTPLWGDESHPASVSSLLLWTCVELTVFAPHLTLLPLPFAPRTVTATQTLTPGSHNASAPAFEALKCFGWLAANQSHDPHSDPHSRSWSHDPHYWKSHPGMHWLFVSAFTGFPGFQMAWEGGRG